MRTVVGSPIDRLLVAMIVPAVSLTACETGKPTGGHRTTGGPAPTNSSPPPAPRSAAGGPDAQAYGASDGYLVGDRSTDLRVGSHSHLDQVFEGRLVHRAPTPSPLARAAEEPPISYGHWS